MLNDKQKKLLKDILYIVVGTAAVAAGLVVFTIPNDIAPGGVSGLATALSFLLCGRISVGVLTLLINVPLFFFTARRFGYGPLLSSLAATLLLSLFIALFDYVLPPYTGNVLLAAVLGGVVMGFGMALLFMRGASTGGTDLLSLLLNDLLPNFSVSKLLLGVDALVVLVAVLIFRDVEVALYSIVTIYVTTKVIDGIMQGADSERVIYAITERGDEVNRRLTVELERGVTLLDARGGYTGKEKKLFMVITHRNQFAQTLAAIKQTDPEAFIFVSNASEVHGEGFKPMK